MLSQMVKRIIIFNVEFTVPSEYSGISFEQKYFVYLAWYSYQTLTDKQYFRPTTIVILTSKYIYGLNAGYIEVYLERKGERA